EQREQYEDNPYNRRVHAKVPRQAGANPGDHSPIFHASQSFFVHSYLLFVLRDVMCMLPVHYRSGGDNCMIAVEYLYDEQVARVAADLMHLPPANAQRLARMRVLAVELYD